MVSENNQAEQKNIEILNPKIYSSVFQTVGQNSQCGLQASVGVEEHLAQPPLKTQDIPFRLLCLLVCYLFVYFVYII